MKFSFPNPEKPIQFRKSVQFVYTQPPSALTLIMKTHLTIQLLQLSAKERDGGFTLVEMLVVILVIGILSAIALPSFLNQTAKARQAEGSAYVGSVNRAQQAHYMENATFAQLNDLELGIADGTYFTYSSVPGAGTGTSADVITTATPSGQLRGYAGRVWISSGRNDVYNTQALLCEGTPTTTPNLTGATVCP